MTQHRRHGLELRGGRWCSQKDLERLRREAADGGPKTIEAYLRTQQRCGHRLESDLPIIRRLIYEIAKALPPPARVHTEAGGRLIVVHPLGYEHKVLIGMGDGEIESVPQYSITVTPEVLSESGHWISRGTYISPRLIQERIERGVPARVKLESWDETWGHPFLPFGSSTGRDTESVGNIVSWAHRQLKHIERDAKKKRKKK